MILAGTDTETTGFLESGDHRIIEVYIGLWDFDTRKKVDEFYTLVDPQRSIPLESQRVHKITPADVAGKPIWNEVAPKVHKLLDEESDWIVAHNGEEFDLPFYNQEFKRVGMPIVTTPVFDTMKAKWATATGKNPSLGELCFALGIPYDESKAHGAAYDVGVMMECLFQGLDWGWFKLGDDRAAA